MTGWRRGQTTASLNTSNSQDARRGCTGTTAMSLLKVAGEAHLSTRLAAGTEPPNPGGPARQVWQVQAVEHDSPPPSLHSAVSSHALRSAAKLTKRDEHSCTSEAPGTDEALSDGIKLGEPHPVEGSPSPDDGMAGAQKPRHRARSCSHDERSPLALSELGLTSEDVDAIKPAIEKMEIVHGDAAATAARPVGPSRLPRAPSSLCPKAVQIS